MAGWGRCRNCGHRIWWGTSPYNPDKSFPFEDEDEGQSHFETCAGVEFFTDYQGSKHRVSKCRACSEKVWWETTINGKRRPMNLDADEFVCHFDTCEGQPRGAERPDPEPRRSSTTDPRYAQAPYEVRLWLPDLELAWPCTVAEVTSSFRRLALVHHPDMGGSASDFIRIKLAYDRLKVLLGEGVFV